MALVQPAATRLEMLATRAERNRSMAKPIYQNHLINENNRLRQRRLAACRINDEN